MRVRRAYGAACMVRRRFRIVARLAPAAAAFPASSIRYSAEQVRPHELDHASARHPGSWLELPPDADLAYARAAVSAVLSRGDKDTSMPWENPSTGARGTVTPIAAAYTLDGQMCRDFLASYVSGSSQAWLQGEACKQQQGDWEVRTLKPWKRS